MGSLAELHDLGNLCWDSGTGTLDGDAPYIGNRAWIRNGEAFTTGNANCATWATASASESGTIGVLFSSWDDGGDPTYDLYVPMRVATVPCNTSLPFWRIED